MLSCDSHTFWNQLARGAIWLMIGLAAAGAGNLAFAQSAQDGSPAGGWDLTVPSGPAPAPNPVEPGAPLRPAQDGVTVVPRSEADTSGETDASLSAVPVKFVALLTSDGQRIEKGLVWRIFEESSTGENGGTLIKTERNASPILSLKPGNYIVNAAFGRAHLTRKITISPDAGPAPVTEQFVLNAGGLRVTALIAGKRAPQGSITYAIHTDRDQTDDRQLVLAGVKPGLVIRLNAGIYHIVSTYGDANAVVRSDITVEAGKLTEATIVHTYAKVTFKLVDRSGGEALPGTKWTIQTPEGGIVKESVGALPSHTLAPGSYTVVARNQNKAFRRDFSVEDGQTKEVEIVLQ